MSSEDSGDADTDPSTTKSSTDKATPVSFYVVKNTNQNFVCNTKRH